MLYDMHCPVFRGGHDPRLLPVVCGALDDSWCIRVKGRERWFAPIVAGDHDGPVGEQPIVNIDGAHYRVGMCCAVRL